MALTSKDVETLLKVLKECGLFDVVVVDMSSRLDDRNRSILNNVDRIMLVERPEDIAQEKIKAFFSQSYIVNQMREKLVSVLNFDTNQDMETYGGIPELGRISTYQRTNSGAALLDALGNERALDFLAQVTVG